jgi:hypothetical protein
MTDDRIHRAVSADGTEIAGRVHGQGPPLVLVHGVLDDGDLAWEALVPHLTDRFTCYLPSVRGRGLSGDSPDSLAPAPPGGLRRVRRQHRRTGLPGGLVGRRSWALGAAARSDAVAAVVLYEPFGVRGDAGGRPRPFRRRVEQVEEAACRRPTRRWISRLPPLRLHRRRVRRPGGGLPRAVRKPPPGDARSCSQRSPTRGPGPPTPRCSHRSPCRSCSCRARRPAGTFFADSAQHIAQHVADPHVRELPGVGHFAPVVAPEPIAKN